MIDTKALRKNLLSLAVTGKITKQSEFDRPVSDAIEEYIPKMDIEFPKIPKTWKYCKFDDVLINRDSERIPVSVADRKKLDKVYDYYGASGVIDKVDSYLFDETLLLIGEDGANLLSRSTPIAFLAQGKYWVNNHAHVLAATEHILLEYAEIVINSMSLVPYVTGAAQPKLSQNMMNKIAIPVPPIEEQQRIVDVLKETFEVLDKIDELQKLYSSDIEILKAKLIDAGIQGKLTEQLPEDGTAEALYEEIQKEKARLIKDKKIKKEKVLPEISEEEIPFEVPDSWKWVRLNSIGSWSAGATPSRGNKEYYKGNIPWVKTGELQNGIIWNTEEYISELALNECSVRLNPIGSVLLAMYGATIGKVGILEIEATTNQACCACIPYRGIYNKFLFYYLLAHKNDFIARSHGGAQPNISKEIIISELFPLPPFAEQKRIVERIEELLSII